MTDVVVTQMAERLLLPSTDEQTLLRALADIQNQFETSSTPPADIQVPTLLHTLHRLLWSRQPPPTSTPPDAALDSTSESELSDLSSSHPPPLARTTRSGQRELATLATISAIALASPRDCWPLWPLFLPERAGTRRAPPVPTLVTVLLYDGSSRARGAAASCIAALLHNSYRVLSPAPPPPPPTPSSAAAKLHPAAHHRTPTTTAPHFASLQSRMADTAAELYACVGYALQVERNPTCVAQIVRCASVLATSAPAPRVPAPRVAALVGHLARVMARTGRADMTVRAAATSCMAALLAANPPGEEDIGRALQSVDLLRRMVAGLGKEASAPLVPETLAVIAAIAARYPDKVGHVWSDLQPGLSRALRKDDDVLRLHAMRCILHFVAAEHEAHPANHEMWTEIFQRFVAVGVNDAFHAVRETSLTSVAQFPLPHQVRLDKPVLRRVATSVLRALRDKTVGVRTEAAPAIVSLCKGSHATELFHLPAEALGALSMLARGDTNAAVRSRALHAIMSIVEYATVSRLVLLPDDVVARVWESVRTGLYGKESVRPAATRAAGRMAIFAAQQSKSDVTEQAVDSLMKISEEGDTSSKVRWHAIDALTTCIAHPNLNSRLPALLPRACEIADTAWSSSDENASARLRLSALNLMSALCRTVGANSRIWSFLVVSSRTLSLDETVSASAKRIELGAAVGTLLVNLLRCGGGLDMLEQNVVLRLPLSSATNLTDALLRHTKLPVLALLESGARAGSLRQMFENEAESDTWSLPLLCQWRDILEWHAQNGAGFEELVALFSRVVSMLQSKAL